MRDAGEVFAQLYATDVKDHIEQKNNGNKNLSYLSWTWALAEMKKQFPEVTFEVVRQENGLPYVYDEKTGYMVFTNVTVEGLTYPMWLPVMDSHNAAMKAEPYHVKTKFSEYDVEAATMTDINKTIMRCLTKNFALFGLGLYIYAGEDLPEDMAKPEEKKAEEKKPEAKKPTETKREQPKSEQNAAVQEASIRAKFLAECNRRYNADQIGAICKKYRINKLNEISQKDALEFLKLIEMKDAKAKEDKND